MVDRREFLALPLLGVIPIPLIGSTTAYFGILHSDAEKVVRGYVYAKPAFKIIRDDNGDLISIISPEGITLKRE